MEFPILTYSYRGIPGTLSEWTGEAVIRFILVIRL